MTKRALLAAGITSLMTAALLVLPAAVANAGTLRIQDNHPYLVLVYAAPLGEQNDVTASLSGTTYTVHDTAGVTAAPGCDQIDAATASCTGTFHGFSIHTRDLADIVHLVNVSAVVYGEGGNDQLFGGSGNDVLDGGPGADLLSGGGGYDRVTYLTRSAPVSVSMDGQANDGEAGEGDNISNDVESVEGGTGNDTMIGNNDPNSFFGWYGNDTVDGRGGNDSLSGGPDDDIVRGGSGDDSLGGGQYGVGVGTDADRLLGGPGNDTIDGAQGNDVVQGGTGNDTLAGGQGDDQISGGPGQDSLDGSFGADSLNGGADDDTLTSADNGGVDSDVCGDGTDSVHADTADTVAPDCETVTTS